MSCEETNVATIEETSANDAGDSVLVEEETAQEDVAAGLDHEIDGVVTDEVNSEENGTDCGTEKKSHKTKITFKFKSDPPSFKESISTTTILPSGKFSKRQRHCSTYVNSNRKAAPVEEVYYQGREEEEEEEEEQYTGMQFVATGYPERIPVESRRYTQPRYERRNYSTFWDRPRDRLNYSSLLGEMDEKETLRRAKDVEEVVAKGLQNKYCNAIPEDLIWKSVGKRTEYLPLNSICPCPERMEHIKFKRSEVEAEKYRMDLVYKMICEGGMMHIEDLWKVYLRRNKMEDHPFDGFTHFSRFITDRSHVFGMDRNLMVYNQNLLVTVTVLQYVHALYHGNPATEAHRVFKPQARKILFRAFLFFMAKDNLSFDLFFINFPSLFQYDNNSSTWKLNKSSACSIPSAFLPDCLPKRNHTTPHVDRSIIFNGVGQVFANNIAKIKILSEDSLRSHIKYVVSVPVHLCDEAEKYSVESRVAFSGVRLYNGNRETVQGTRIELIGEKNFKTDGRIDVFTVNDEEDEENIECIKESGETEVRISQVRDELALREEEKKMAMRRALKKESVNAVQLFNEVKKEFCNNWDDFLSFIHNRPFYYSISEKDGEAFVCKRPTKVRRKMIELMIELDMGKDGRSFYKDEAEEKCSSFNSSLDETGKFTLDHLSQVVDYRKMLVTSLDGTPRVVSIVSPRFYWDHKHKMLLQL